MEYDLIIDTTRGYADRMRRMALFEPLYDLERKREQDGRGVPIDMKGLGLLTLLFFFEKKLMRERKTGALELAAYLQRLTEAQYELDEVRCEQIARTIIQTFRPTTGKRRSYHFYDWEHGDTSELEYSILKADGFDPATSRQYYTLDEDGLELIFATKEFYAEFQLSIHQLMLRKQLEKGEFTSALRQINEMRVDVEVLYDRMDKLQHEIQRNIVSEETFERYEKLLDDIYQRLQREHEEFDELREFVQETQKRLYDKDVHLKEARTYALVLEINNELESVHYEHSRLLKTSIELKNKSLRAAQESLYYSGIESFNFDQDLMAHVIGTPLPLEAMKGVLHPFLPVRQPKRWSLLTILAEQNITEERETGGPDAFLGADDDAHADETSARIRRNYRQIMEQLLQHYEQGCRTLAEIVAAMREQKRHDWLAHRSFYDFWLLAHQRSPLALDSSNDEGERQHLFDEALELLWNRKLHVTELPQVLQVTPRYSIQNMQVEVEEMPL